MPLASRKSCLAARPGRGVCAPRAWRVACDNFLYGFKGSPAARQPSGLPDRPRGIAKPRWERVDLDAMTARARAGTAGDAPYSGAALGRDLRCGSPPVAAHRRSAPPHPQAGGSAGNARRWPRRASWAGPSSTRRASCHRAKITVKGARCAHVATAMALRATFECDLPRARPRHLSGGRGRTGTTTLRSIADPGNFREVDECCLTCGQAADVFSWLALSRAVVRTQCGPSRPGGTGLGRALNTGS